MSDTVTAMTVEAAAKALDGSEYGEEGSRGLWAEMKAAGLVAVFGASDDLMEFRGAIDDEAGAYEGATAYVTKDGLLSNECENDDCPYFAKVQKTATPIDAIWMRDGVAWSYDTAIPHKTFTVHESGDPFCHGIVFALADVPA